MAASKSDAPFVFEGTVKQLSASNVSAVPADNRTVIVQVDHVRQAPRSLAGLAGKELTVRTADNEKLQDGEKGVFFADSLVFGEQLAVQSLGHDPVAPHEAKAAIAGATPVVQKLRQRMDMASSVVSGQVKEVRPSAVPEVKGASLRGASMPSAPISEHAPIWQEAVIQVSAVHKGAKQKQVVVRFPASTDVKWRRAPKFKKGQKGTWFLHSAQEQPVSARARALVSAEPFYTALDPNDFHSEDEAPLVQSMLPGAAPVSSAKKP